MDKQKQFSAWVSDYTDGLYNWAYYKTSSKEVAEDLVQETFLAAYKSLDKFEGKSSPKSWLTSILNHKIIDYYRRADKKNISLEGMEEDQAIQVTEGFFNEQQRWKTQAVPAFWEDEDHLLNNPDFVSVFDACIDDLPGEWNMIVAGRFLENKKSKDICQEFDITSSNYWQIVHRAKLLLKKCIELNWTT